MRGKNRQTASNVLNKIYYNYGQEGALLNNVSLLKSIANKEKRGRKITTEQVNEFLSKQPAYTVHKRFRKAQFRRRQIRVAAKNVRVDCDLIELGDLAYWNDGYRYIMLMIDGFTRFMWAVPLKNKESTSAANALKEVIKDNKDFTPLAIYTDAGKEFVGAAFQSVLKKHNIKHRICSSEDFHCPFVERAIRTVKEKLFQAMTTNYSRRWLDFLPMVVSTYNKSFHSSTKTSPEEASMAKNYLNVLRNITPKPHPPTATKYKYKRGDLVRILKSQNQGALKSKGYLPRYTWELFKISKPANDRSFDKNSPTPAYILEDLDGNIIEHSVFYEPELSFVHTSQLNQPAPIKKILEERGDKVKIWFMGFPEKDAQWVPRKNLVYKH